MVLFNGKSNIDKNFRFYDVCKLKLSLKVVGRFLYENMQINLSYTSMFTSFRVR